MEMETNDVQIKSGSVWRPKLRDPEYAIAAAGTRALIPPIIQPSPIAREQFPHGRVRLPPFTFHSALALMTVSRAE